MALLIPVVVKELKEQGRQEERAEWDAWLRRRNEAEANNRPFDEPPPSQRQQGSAVGTSAGLSPPSTRRVQSFGVAC